MSFLSSLSSLFSSRPSTPAPAPAPEPRDPGAVSRDQPSDVHSQHATIEQPLPPKSGTPRVEPPLTTSARHALRQRERLQGSSPAPVVQTLAPTPELMSRASQQCQEALQYQLAISYMNRMTALVQSAQAMVGGSIWPTWSPYVTVSTSLPWVNGTPYFSPYCSPFDPTDDWTTAGAVGAGLLGAGVVGAGLLGCGLVANTLGHAVGSTFGGAINGLFNAFCW